MKAVCPRCGTSYRFPDDAVGKAGRCKKCQKTFKIVAASAAGTSKPPAKAVKPAKPSKPVQSSAASSMAPIPLDDDWDRRAGGVPDAPAARKADKPKRDHPKTIDVSAAPDEYEQEEPALPYGMKPLGSVPQGRTRSPSLPLGIACIVMAMALPVAWLAIPWFNGLFVDTQQDQRSGLQQSTVKAGSMSGLTFVMKGSQLMAKAAEATGGANAATDSQMSKFKIAHYVMIGAAGLFGLAAVVGAILTLASLRMHVFATPLWSSAVAAGASVLFVVVWSVLGPSASQGAGTGLRYGPHTGIYAVIAVAVISAALAGIKMALEREST